tara:strand:- start:1837 stop:2601 length:765 start_codon:yes stop_codon:yes gene_type:complete
MKSLIDLKAINYITTKPLTRNKKGLLIQKPFIQIQEGDEIYSLTGRDVMWSYFDAIFYQDPLPRPPVEDDLFAPTVNSPSLLSLLQEFTTEAVENGNRYIQVEHDKDGTVRMFANLDDKSKNFDDIQVVGSMLNTASGGLSLHVPLIYRTQSGNHIRPALVHAVKDCAIVVYDIGHSYYFAVRGFCSVKMQVGLCEPMLIKKKDSVGLAMTVKDTVELCVKHLTTTTLKKNVNHKLFTTREYDLLLHQRLGVRI